MSSMVSASRLKRRASSSPDHTDKRVRLSSNSKDDLPQETASQLAVFESAEIFLHILSFLPVDDIINVERVSRYWRRMAEDGSLWRKMYLERFPYPSSHHLRAHSHTLVNQQKRIATPLPLTSRSVPLDRALSGSGSVDWKTLMKIGTNWTKGNAQTHSLSPSPSPHVKTPVRDMVELARTPTRPKIAPPAVLAESPFSSRSTELKTVEGSSFPIHPPGFPVPLPIANGSHEPYRRRLGSSRHLVPRPTARPVATETHPQASVPRHLLCLAGNYVLVTYPNSPLLHVHDSRPVKSDPVDSAVSQREGALIAELSQTSTSEMNQPIALIPPPPGWSSPSRPDLITAIAVDDPDHQDIRIALFYQSGGFVVLALDPHPEGDRKIWSRIVVHIPPISHQNRKRHFIPPTSERVVLAGLKGQVLVGVTGKFYISIYRLKESGAGLAKVLHSDVASWPASLTIDEAGGKDDSAEDKSDELDDRIEQDRLLRVKLGYCSPIYPKSWKPSIQAIDITLVRSSSVSRSPDLRVELLDPIELVRTRVGSRSLMIGVKSVPSVGARVISMSNRWVVLAGRDNLVEVYSIRETGWLEHEQTLLGHAAGVRSVALRDDKCVTSGNDGRVLVWRLDKGASLRPPDQGPDDDEVEEGAMIEVRAGKKHSTVDFDRKDEQADVFRQTILPIPPVTHPMSLVSAARELISAPPEGAQRVRDLAFNEDTIVGLLAELESEGTSEKEGVVKVWKFDA